jgi:nucleoside-diphosphate-sugar epimerase
MRILVTGVTGQVGAALRTALETVDSVIAAELDLTGPVETQEDRLPTHASASRLQPGLLRDIIRPA